MLGKSQIQITGNQFSAGLASSDFLGDGGIGTGSQNLSLASQPGVVRATYSYAPTVTGSGHTPAQFVASNEDPSSVNQTDRILVDTNSQWWHSDNGGVTWKISGAATYTDGITDMVSFNYGGTNYVFATTISNIARYTPSTASLSEAFWTSTLSQSSLSSANPHPLLVYQGFMWVADGNTLYQIPASGTSVSAALTLDPGELILALGIDPGTGLMLISVTTLPGFGDYASARRSIYFYDGYSSKSRRKIPMETTLTAFSTVGGTLFCVGEDGVYSWNGNGLTFLRRLTNVSTTKLITKQRITNFGNTLVVANGAGALAFGDVQNGKKVWYPLFNTSATIDLIAFAANKTGTGNATSPRLVVAFNGGISSTVNYIEPFNQVASAGTLYTNDINFPRPVFIRSIRVYTTGITTTAGIGGIGIIDEKNVTHTPTQSAFVVAAAESPKYMFEFTFGGQRVNILQPFVTFSSSQVFGFVKMVIYYDTAE